MKHERNTPMSELDPGEKPSQWFKVQVAMPTELLDVWEAARSKAQRAGLQFRPDVPEPVNHGMFVEVLLADYLAGPEQ